MMEMCYKRPEKYIAKALRLATEFRKYNVSDGAIIIDVYSLLSAAILGGPKWWDT